MNTHPLQTVRWALLVLLVAGTLHAAAQGKRDSLTKDFNKLSSKERSRIAAREAEEAAADTTYQGYMRRADHAFQAGQYPVALDLFKQARALRPYNVYPKVKIEDLEALINKQRSTAEVKSTSVKPETAATSTPPPERASVGTTPDPTAETAKPQVVPTKPQPAPQVIQQTPGHRAPAETEPQPSSMQERIYREAGAVVIERTVQEEGLPVVYKKVVHNWGQTFFFRSGMAIPAQQWVARFNE